MIFDYSLKENYSLLSPKVYNQLGVYKFTFSVQDNSLDLMLQQYTFVSLSILAVWYKIKQGYKTQPRFITPFLTIMAVDFSHFAIRT